MKRRGRFLSRSGLACCIIAGLVVTGCDDNTKQPLAPEPRLTLDGGLESGVVIIEGDVPESVKNAFQAPASPGASPSLGISANILSAPGASFTTVGGSSYSVTAVAFAPEPAPAPPPVGVNGPACDDCVHSGIVIGFAFTFYGNTYSALNISSNGFLQFGASTGDHCCSGGDIPVITVPNNIIAVSWTDWVPGTGALRYERRGTAPNRKFIVQWTNVPEYAGAGRLTAQIVLSEGSNDITMYTTQQTIQLSGHYSTQGIENANGSEATFVAGRVQSLASRYNDGVRFSTQVTNQPPSIVAPPNITLPNDGGACSANIGDLGDPVPSDDTPDYIIDPVRDDGASLADPYPVGTTTVTYTITDAGGLTASADQTVTVSDTEPPTVTAPANVTVPTDPGQAYATVSPPPGSGTDNCGTVTVTPPAGGQFPLGTTTHTYVAEDGAGLQSTANWSVTVIDEENPVLTIPASFSVNATMPGGAVVNFAASATDNSGDVSVSCSRTSGSTFAIGSVSVTCTATDGSGNTAIGSFTVTVVSARAQLEALIARVTVLALNNGTSQPLLNMLGTALRDPGANSPEVACIKLGDFVFKMQDHKAVASITQANIDSMIADAKRIQRVLGCP